MDQKSLLLNGRGVNRMNNFQYEWWAVSIKSEVGTMTWEFKGKDKEHVIKQIEKEIKRRDSEKNQKKPASEREERILKVYWETLKFDRKGYSRTMR